VSLVSQSQLPSCPPEGCFVVTGVLFELSDDLTTGSDWLEPLFASMPLSEGVSAVARADRLRQKAVAACFPRCGGSAHLHAKYGNLL
jgi:hypothetical protein